jgi:predicted RNA-binding protein with RPS1 domain
MVVQISNIDNREAELTKSEKSEMVGKVIELLLSKERKGWKKGEKKKETFQTLASRFGLSERTIANTYYRSVKIVVEEENKKKENKKESRNSKLHIVKNENIAINKVVDSSQTKDLEEEKAGDSDKKEVANKEVVKSELIDSNTDKKVSSFSYQTNNYTKKIELDSLGRPLKPPYKPNDIIDVKVDHIRDFGVFCYTLDEYEYKGLLHISEIKEIFVSDANDYFEIGDIIKVKVLMSQPNRLTFSTRDLRVQMKNKKKEETIMADTSLPKNPPINVIGEKFGKELQSKITTYQVNKPKTAFKNEVEDILKEDHANIDKAEIEALFAEQLKEEEERMKEKTKQKEESEIVENVEAKEIAVLPTRINEQDFADVQSFLNNKIGALSPKAQLKLMQILDKQGMFKSTLAISKVSENFIVDYGLIFMEMVANELEKDECL